MTVNKQWDNSALYENKIVKRILFSVNLFIHPVTETDEILLYVTEKHRFTI